MAEENDYGLSAQELADFKSAKNLYSRFGLGSEEDRAAQFEEQKSMTRANILFDLAQAGLIIAATPPTKGESPAATLARAAASSEFFPKVGARSAELQKTKTAMDAQERQMDMMAVQRMQQQKDVRDQQKFELGLAKAKAKPLDKDLYKITYEIDGTKQTKVFDLNSTADIKEYDAISDSITQIFKVGTEPAASKKTQPNLYTLRFTPEQLSKIKKEFPETEIFKTQVIDANDKTAFETARNLANIYGGQFFEQEAGPLTPNYVNIIAADRTTVLGVFDKNTQQAEIDDIISKNEGAYEGDPTNVSRSIITVVAKNGKPLWSGDINTADGLAKMNEVIEANPGSAPGTPETISDSDIFSKFGFLSMAELEAFREENPDMFAYMQGAPVLTDKDYMAKFGLTKAEFLALDDTVKRRLLDLDPEAEFRIVNEQIVDITDPSDPKVIFGNPKVKTVTLGGEVLDITNPDDVKVIYGNKDRDIRIVKGQLVEITNGKPVPIFGERTPLTGTFENMLLRNGKNIIVKKVGQDLYDTEGNKINLDSEEYQGAILIDKSTAYDNVGSAKERAIYQEKLEEVQREENNQYIKSELNKGKEVVNKEGEKVQLVPKLNDTKFVFDALEAARKGTGFWAVIRGSFATVVGGVIPPLRDVFKETQEARNYIRAVNVLLRVGIANSPRFAEGEQGRLGTLISSPDVLFANPEDSVRKLMILKKIMKGEYKLNLKILASSEKDTVIRRNAKNQNIAIEGALKLIENIPEDGFVSDEDYNKALERIEIMRGERNK